MKILRIQDVKAATGLSRTTLWRMERRGDFPKRCRLGRNSCGWIAQEVEAWIASRPRGMTVAGPEVNIHANAEVQ